MYGHRAWLLGGVLVTAMAAACSDAATDPGTDAGVYVLQSVNAKALPVVVVDTMLFGLPAKVQWNAGILAMGEEGGVSFALNQTITLNVSTMTRTDTVTGTWTKSGSRLSFDFSSGGESRTASGTRSGTTLTLTMMLDDIGTKVVAKFKQ